MRKVKPFSDCRCRILHARPEPSSSHGIYILLKMMRLVPLRLLAPLLLLAATPAFGIEALEARNRSFRLLNEGVRDYDAGR